MDYGEGGHRESQGKDQPCDSLGQDGMVELSIQGLYNSIILVDLVGGWRHLHMVIPTIFVISRLVNKLLVLYFIKLFLAIEVCQ